VGHLGAGGRRGDVDRGGDTGADDRGAHGEPGMGGAPGGGGGGETTTRPDARGASAHRTQPGSGAAEGAEAPHREEPGSGAAKAPHREEPGNGAAQAKLGALPTTQSALASTAHFMPVCLRVRACHSGAPQ
jgi:hypothetical protein